MSTVAAARRAGFLAIAGAIAAVLTACTNSEPSLRLVSVVPPTSMPIRLSADIQPIFNQNCATLGCHAGDLAAQGLNLESGKAYQNLVNVPSTELPSLSRVLPGSSPSSYLVNKLEGTAILGVPMPYGQPSLPAAEIQLIKEWIDQGAADN